MMKWYEKSNPLCDIVISSRIRLARNLSNYPFSSRMSAEQKSKLEQEVMTSLENVNLGENALECLKTDKLEHYKGQAMVEQHIISPGFLQDNDSRLLILSKDRSISIMINEEDHIRLQVMSAGLDLETALDTANKLDDVMDERLNYAFDAQLGFLTACPSNLGTGLRASVMLHIPALEKAGALNKLSGTLSKLGLTLRGTYGEGTKATGALYQISNQVTLGLSEEQAIKNLREIVLQIVEKEREARNALVSSEAFVDQLYRHYGTLKYAKMISTEEFYDLMSYLRIGMSQKIYPEETLKDKGTEALNALMFKVGGATLCAEAKQELSPQERDKLRAQLIQNTL